MLPQLPIVEVDLAIEHEGHTVHIHGRHPRFIATLPSLKSLLHFLAAAWPHRKLMPAGIGLEVRLGKWSFPVRSAP